MDNRKRPVEKSQATGTVVVSNSHTLQVLDDQFFLYTVNVQENKRIAALRVREGQMVIVYFNLDQSKTVTDIVPVQVDLVCGGADEEASESQETEQDLA